MFDINTKTQVAIADIILRGMNTTDDIYDRYILYNIKWDDIYSNTFSTVNSELRVIITRIASNLDDNYV